MTKLIFRAILWTAVAAGLAAAGEPAKQEPVKIPPDAVKIDANTSRHTDAQGRTWIYRRTPFGVIKQEEKPGESAAKALTAAGEEPPPGMKVREEKDLLHFERPTPFGVYRWSRPKTELTEMERIVWERSRKAAEPAEREKPGEGKAEAQAKKAKDAKDQQDKKE